jgi:hypothetical protein
MSLRQNNPFDNQNNLASLFHRISGNRCYCSDIDSLHSSLGETSMFLESKFNAGKPELSFMADYKMPGKTLSDKWAGVQIQLADAERTPALPLFHIITYLGSEYPVKMFYVIGVNQLAQQSVSGMGSWFSVREFSQWQHQMRKIKWNPEETLDAKNVENCGLNPKVVRRLIDLPAERKEYPLPKLDYSWQNGK